MHVQHPEMDDLNESGTNNHAVNDSDSDEHHEGGGNNILKNTNKLGKKAGGALWKQLETRVTERE